MPSYADLTAKLDDSNFTTYIQEHPFVFVKFYAPWCGHCKAMVGDYNMVAFRSYNDKKEYVLAEVDCTVATKTAEEMGVEGYPTLKLFAYGNAIDYPGERKRDPMTEWLDKMMTSQIQTVSEDKVKELIGTADFLLIQGASEEQLKFLRFISLQDIDLYAIEGSEFKITLHLKNTRTLEYTGDVSINDIANWAFQSTITSVVALSSDKAIRYVFETPEKLPSFMLVKGHDWTDLLHEELIEYCEENRDKLTCGYAE